MKVAKLLCLYSCLKGAKKFARTFLNLENKLWHSCPPQVYDLDTGMAFLRIVTVFPN